MMTVYKTDNRVLHEVEEMDPGVWIMMTNPTMEESQEVAEKYDIDMVDVRAALDEEESSRIELEDGYTLILVYSGDGDRLNPRLYHNPAGYPSDTGMYYHSVHRGDTDPAAFY